MLLNYMLSAGVDNGARILDALGENFEIFQLNFTNFALVRQEFLKNLRLGQQQILILVSSRLFFIHFFHFSVFLPPIVLCRPKQLPSSRILLRRVLHMQ
jgi:hypothetical protein